MNRSAGGCVWPSSLPGISALLADLRYFESDKMAEGGRVTETDSRRRPRSRVREASRDRGGRLDGYDQRPVGRAAASPEPREAPEQAGAGSVHIHYHITNIPHPHPQPSSDEAGPYHPGYAVPDRHRQPTDYGYTFGPQPHYSHPVTGYDGLQHPTVPDPLQPKHVHWTASADQRTADEEAWNRPTATRHRSEDRTVHPHRRLQNQGPMWDKKNPEQRQPNSKALGIPSVSPDEWIKVFKFLLARFGGRTTLVKFMQEKGELLRGLSTEEVAAWLRHSQRFLFFDKTDRVQHVSVYCKAAQVCFRYRKRGTGPCDYCDYLACPYFHLCLDLVAGACQRARRSCHFNHSFHSGSNAAVCAAAGLLAFTDSEIHTIVRCSSPAVCSKFNQQQGSCSDDCPDLHVCWKYVQNNTCDKDKTTCPLGHSLTDTDHNKWVLDVFRKGHLTEDFLAKIVLCHKDRASDSTAAAAAAAAARRSVPSHVDADTPSVVADTPPAGRGVPSPVAADTPYVVADTPSARRGVPSHVDADTPSVVVDTPSGRRGVPSPVAADTFSVVADTAAASKASAAAPFVRWSSARLTTTTSTVTTTTTSTTSSRTSNSISSGSTINSISDAAVDRITGIPDHHTADYARNKEVLGRITAIEARITNATAAASGMTGVSVTQNSHASTRGPTTEADTAPSYCNPRLGAASRGAAGTTGTTDAATVANKSRTVGANTVALMRALGTSAVVTAGRTAKDASRSSGREDSAIPLGPAVTRSEPKATASVADGFSAARGRVTLGLRANYPTTPAVYRHTDKVPATSTCPAVAGADRLAPTDANDPVTPVLSRQTDKVPATTTSLTVAGAGRLAATRPVFNASGASTPAVHTHPSEKVSAAESIVARVPWGEGRTASAEQGQVSDVGTGPDRLPVSATLNTATSPAAGNASKAPTLSAGVVSQKPSDPFVYLCEHNTWTGACVKKMDCLKIHRRGCPSYLWQLMVDGRWKSVSSANNVAMETSYCKLTSFEEMEVAVNAIGLLVLHLEYNLLQATVMNDGDSSDHVTAGQVCQMRRCSTPSYVDAEPATPLNFYTQWCWYYRYASQDYRPFKPAILQYTLEAKFVTDQPNYSYEAGGKRFEVSFQAMKVVNLIKGRSYVIQRRPAYHSGVSPPPASGNLAVPPEMCDLLLRDLPFLPIASLPSYWSRLDAFQDFEMVELDLGGKEGLVVSKTFHTSMTKDVFQMIKVFRVQNPSLYDKYCSMKRSMSSRLQNGADVDERNLFHRTPSYATARSLCANGLDFRLVGEDSQKSLCGRGTYFSATALKCHRPTTTQGSTHYMFLAKVLVGQYTEGKAEYTKPPVREGLRLYDSCVDDVANPNIFVIFDLAQSYPDYLIEYQDDSQFTSSALKCTLLRS